MTYKICFFDHCVMHYAYERFLCERVYTDFDSAYFDRKALSIRYPDIDFFILEEKA